MGASHLFGEKRVPVKALQFIILALAVICLSGCTTDSDGTTRFDAAAFREVVTTGTDLYDRYNAQDRAYAQPAL